LQISRFDGVIAFGEALRSLYLIKFGIDRVWTLHEAADTSVFYPRELAKQDDVVWIGNWGDDERSREIREFLVYPAATLTERKFRIYGVRYPQSGLDELASAGIHFGGYLPNLEAPAAYAAARLTVHIPRQQYTAALTGIPTIRVFEALASGIPLISAPWSDVEGLFSEGDFLFARSSEEMIECMEALLSDPVAAGAQAEKGLATVLSRHTCAHRALELTRICEEVLA
jgi:spore maturation protein CgeB